MKKLFSYVMGGCLLAACAGTPTDEISGVLTDMPTDSLVVYSYPADAKDNSQTKIDTVVMQQGKFALNVGDSVVKQIAIRPIWTPKPDADGRIPATPMRMLTFPLFPDMPVVVKGSVRSYTLSGAPVYEDYSNYLSQLHAQSLQLDSLTRVTVELQRSGLRDSFMTVFKQAHEIQKNIQKMSADYVRQNPDKDAAAVVLAEIRDIELVKEVINNIGESVRTGVAASFYQSVKESYDKTMAREAAKEKIKEGAEAPDFTLKDINGKDFTLSSLRGKYVVLDFWGSWCGWCIKGMPEMKKYYEKYKSKMEIVGIDCNDAEDAWKAAVEKHELPWTHVRNEGDPDVSVMYAIEGYPTKIVLDKEGKIAKIVVGESPEFYTYLDSVMK